MKKVVFVSNCLLNQNMRARGVRNKYCENNKPTNVEAFCRFMFKV